MKMRSLFLYGVCASLVLATSCVVTTDDDDDEPKGEAGDTSTGGSDSSTGGRSTGGTSTGGSTTGGTDGGASDGNGGTDSTGAGAGGDDSMSTGGVGGSTGGSGGSGGSANPTPVDCANAEPLPDSITEDLSVGPGCVRIDRTIVSGGAKLTIAAGSTVQFAPAGYLDIESAALSAVGTAAQPIVFTSDQGAPSPGDWQCVYLDGASSDVSIEHAFFEYGGDGCDANGARNEAMLVIDSSARAVSNNTFRRSISNGVMILADGNVRAFENNAFAENEEPSINVAAPQVLQLGTGLTFADADDYILVNSTFGLASSGNWLAQPVPFRLVGGFDIHDQAEVTLDAGLRLELDGGTFEVFNANMIVAGTEDAPVTFTSSFSSPGAGDWGCIYFSSVQGTPRFDYAVIEYAGNGQGCGGAQYEGALIVPDAAIIRNTVFRDIDGFAIQAAECNVTDWCENTFESVEVGPLSCESAEPTPCP
jgi:hypothetical protein